MISVGSVRADDNLDIQIQLLDNEIMRLTSEKQERFRDLESCASRVSGFRIAGVSLIGLTAVGVGVNIYQYTERGRRDTRIETLQTEIETLRRGACEDTGGVWRNERCDCDSSKNIRVIADGGECECVAGSDWLPNRRDGCAAAITGLPTVTTVAPMLTAPLTIMEIQRLAECERERAEMTLRNLMRCELDDTNDRGWRMVEDRQLGVQMRQECEENRARQINVSPHTLGIFASAIVLLNPDDLVCQWNETTYEFDLVLTQEARNRMFDDLLGAPATRPAIAERVQLSQDDMNARAQAAELGGNAPGLIDGAILRKYCRPEPFAIVSSATPRGTFVDDRTLECTDGRLETPQQVDFQAILRPILDSRTAAAQPDCIEEIRNSLLLTDRDRRTHVESDHYTDACEARDDAREFEAKIEIRGSVFVLFEREDIRNCARTIQNDWGRRSSDTVRGETYRNPCDALAAAERIGRARAGIATGGGFMGMGMRARNRTYTIYTAAAQTPEGLTIENCINEIRNNYERNRPGFAQAHLFERSRGSFSDPCAALQAARAIGEEFRIDISYQPLRGTHQYTVYTMGARGIVRQDRQDELNRLNAMRQEVRDMDNRITALDRQIRDQTNRKTEPERQIRLHEGTIASTNPAITQTAKDRAAEAIIRERVTVNSANAEIARLTSEREALAAERSARQREVNELNNILNPSSEEWRDRG